MLLSFTQNSKQLIQFLFIELFLMMIFVPKYTRKIIFDKLGD